MLTPVGILAVGLKNETDAPIKINHVKDRRRDRNGITISRSACQRMLL